MRFTDRRMGTRGISAYVLLAVVAGGCGGNSGGDGGGETQATSGASDTMGTGADDTAGALTSGADTGEPESGIKPGPSPIRRMTRREYNNTIFDLLGDDSKPASGFPAEEEALGFNNNADALVVTQLLAEGYLNAAEELAAKAVADMSKLMDGCDPGADGEDTCARAFIENFGFRAFRRPLATDDVDTWMVTFNGAREQFDFETAVRLTVTAMLQSPHFLYRVEFGQPIEDEPGVLKIGPYELASRLSYFLWGTMPDVELFDAAGSGRLETPEDVAKQASRMIADERSREMVREFHGQWLHLSRLDLVEKDAAMFPDFSQDVLPLMRSEAESFIDHVIWEAEGDLETLLLAPYTFMNGALAEYYGVDGPTGDTFEKVELPEGRASGILTQGGLLSVLAKHNQTSPVLRGKFVREMLLCQQVPPPPENISVVPPEVDPNLPTRERFAEHTNDPLCGGCHSMMDPVGFGFEHYDAIGHWRDEEAGQPIDATGELLFTKQGGKFDGVPELADMLAGSPEVDTCMALQWFRYAYGRAETAEDLGTLEYIAGQFAGSGHRILDLIVSLTQTEAFLYRRNEGGSQ